MQTELSEKILGYLNNLSFREVYLNNYLMNSDATGLFPVFFPFLILISSLFKSYYYFVQSQVSGLGKTN